MALSEEQLLSEFKGLFQRLAIILEEHRKQLNELNERERNKEKKQDMPIGKEKVISANDEWQTPTINNAEYNRAKVFLNAGFTPAHTGGISILLYYQKHKIAEVLRVKSSNGSTGGASLVFDIAHLSSFHFVVKNHDASNSTTVTGFKVVMYKEDA